jgi:hypothetical protein
MLVGFRLVGTSAGRRAHPISGNALTTLCPSLMVDGSDQVVAGPPGSSDWGCPAPRRLQNAYWTRVRILCRPQGSLKGKSPVHQRALPHQRELSSAGAARFSSLVAAPGHGGLIRRFAPVDVFAPSGAPSDRVGERSSCSFSRSPRPGVERDTAGHSVACARCVSLGALSPASSRERRLLSCRYDRPARYLGALLIEFG